MLYLLWRIAPGTSLLRACPLAAYRMLVAAENRMTCMVIRSVILHNVRTQSEYHDHILYTIYTICISEILVF